MIIGSYYAIRDKISGNYLPEVYPFRLSRATSYTHQDPQPADVKKPRLFHDVKSARMALGQWLRGFQSAESAYQDRDGEWCGGVVNVAKRPDRIRDNMEIVIVNLEVM